ncbi:MAG: hypothetical protein L0H64_02535 [Pseudonocardia sp.]|nr:hypothetical protein [Pseudonocardia sp.]
MRRSAGAAALGGPVLLSACSEARPRRRP